MVVCDYSPACWTEIAAKYVGIIHSLIATSRKQGSRRTPISLTSCSESRHIANRVYEHTPRLWKEHFAASPQPSDLDRLRRGQRRSLTSYVIRCTECQLHAAHRSKMRCSDTLLSGRQVAQAAMALLTPEKAYIFRITHITNLSWLLDNGMHCRNSAVRDPQFREIGNPDLIERRAKSELSVAAGGTLSDYIAFYFTPRSPMLYNLKTGHNVPSVPMSEIVVLVSSVQKLDELGLKYLLSDRHAVLAGAIFSPDKSGLDQVDWTSL